VQDCPPPDAGARKASCARVPAFLCLLADDFRRGEVENQLILL
jgi:hypothetical protein